MKVLESTHRRFQKLLLNTNRKEVVVEQRLCSYYLKVSLLV